MRHTIFRTRWGPFGLLAVGDAVRRTCLPGLDFGQVQQHLLDGLDESPFEKGLLPDLQRRITAYFDGENVDFSADRAVDLAGCSVFDQMVLAACRCIGPGQRVTYGNLAVKIGKPGSARAVGSALARNPVPLIVPCHRVLCSNGALGGFSAPGGVATKQRMLDHEQGLCRPVTAGGLKKTKSMNARTPPCQGTCRKQPCWP